MPLSLTLAELFSEDRSAVYLSDSEQTLLENYRRLDEEKAKTLLQISETLNKTKAAQEFSKLYTPVRESHLHGL